MEAKIIKLECITNMHVGNGDVNYNIIDNEVERDSITGYPVIHSSGLKGALRDYFVKYKLEKENLKKKNSEEKNLEKENSETENSEDINVEDVFGDENGKAGKVKILGAEMVAIPARASRGNRPYYRVTTEAAVERINELSSLFIGKDLIEKEEEFQKIVKVEGYSGKKHVFIEKIKDKENTKNTENIEKTEIYCLEEADFKNISLPVLARNKLNNGESVNLWYEEVVPHESIFIFPIVSEDKETLEKFKKAVDKKIIQFGGNASIGYGLCQVSVIE